MLPSWWRPDAHLPVRVRGAGDLALRLGDSCDAARTENALWPGPCPSGVPGSAPHRGTHPPYAVVPTIGGLSTTDPDLRVTPAAGLARTRRRPWVPCQPPSRPGDVQTTGQTPVSPLPAQVLASDEISVAVPRMACGHRARQPPWQHFSGSTRTPKNPLDCKIIASVNRPVQHHSRIDSTRQAGPDTDVQFRRAVDTFRPRINGHLLERWPLPQKRWNG